MAEATESNHESKHLTLVDAALRVAGTGEQSESGPIAFMGSRDRIIVSGPDAVGYLQGQLSQQIEKLALGATARSLLLQPQGKVDSWVRVHRRNENEVWLDLDLGFGSGALERLERFKLRTAAEFALESVPVLAIRGRGAAGIVDQTESKRSSIAVLDASWDGLEGCDVAVEAGLDANSTLEALATDLDLERAPDGFGELLRIWQGIPAMGSELDESTIPAAAGVVDSSVDFTKGCYVGQELVARVDSRGNNTPTNLCRLSAPAAAVIETGTELFVSDKGTVGAESVGRVTSVAVWPVDQTVVGLGYIKRSVVSPVELVTYNGTPVQVRS